MTNYFQNRTVLFIVGVACINVLLATGVYVTFIDDAPVDIVNAAEGAKWSYEGKTGPDNWGQLSEDYALCSEGTAQSPINLTGATITALKPISTSYEAAPMAIFNNGHTIQVNYEAGSTMDYNGKTYDVLQFHFHHPSEHVINGQAAPMELHIVHRDQNSGNLAVIGIMLVEGEEENEAYATIFDNLPAEKSEPDETTDLTVDLNSLLPTSTRAYFTYEGSLTTPPCSEVVRWLVMKESVELSAEQIEAFSQIFDMNARPPLELGERNFFSNSQF